MGKTITRETLRKRLEEEKHRLEQELDALAYLHAQSDDTTLDDESYGNHMADVGTETFEMEKNLALESNLRRQLDATDAAMARFEHGTYGICSNCGREISPERLEALPHATLCIDCKRLEEARR